jgi:hypothetical protein
VETVTSKASEDEEQSQPAVKTEQAYVQRAQEKMYIMKP